MCAAMRRARAASCTMKTGPQHEPVSPFPQIEAAMVSRVDLSCSALARSRGGGATFTEPGKRGSGSSVSFCERTSAAVRSRSLAGAPGVAGAATCCRPSKK